MKVNYDNATQVSNALKIIVDDQQVDMKHFKEHFDIKVEDKVHKTTVARTPMKKNKYLCVTCYQAFLIKY